MQIRIKNDKSYELENGTKAYDISKIVKDKYEHDILVGQNDFGLIELSENINSDMELEFFDITNKVGYKVYERGLIYLLVIALREVSNNSVDLQVKYSIEKGIMCNLTQKVSTNLISDLKDKMTELVNKNIVFKKINTSRIEAIEYFTSKGALDKVKLFKQMLEPYVSLYKAMDDYDYFIGPLPFSSACLKYFDLKLIESDKLVLILPQVTKNEVKLEFNFPQTFFDNIQIYESWAKNIDINNIGSLNESIINGKIKDYITIIEARQTYMLNMITTKVIDHHKNIKLVLIGGASSSGKTTTTRKLELALKMFGYHPCGISLDDYFIDRDNIPEVNGKKDFESINAIDLDLFNQHIKDLLEGHEVIMPEYNFIEGKKIFKKSLKLQENDILIVEGLHALNKSICDNIKDELKYKIYLSPTTFLNIDNYNRINMTDIRLLRRLVRDEMTRGYSATKTLEIWESVRYGEENYVFPFQGEANTIFITSLLYELAILKVYAEPLLYSVAHDSPYYAEAKRLLTFLKTILPLSSDRVPEDSIIREFIGGSIFY